MLAHIWAEPASFRWVSALGSLTGFLLDRDGRKLCLPGLQFRGVQRSQLPCDASGSRAGSEKEGWEMAGLSEAVAGLCLGFRLRKYERDTIRAKWESQHCITIIWHQRYVQLWLVKWRERVTPVPESSVCAATRESIYVLLASRVLLRNCVVQMPEEENQIVLFPLLCTWQLLDWNESASVSTQGTNKPWIK